MPAHSVQECGSNSSAAMLAGKKSAGVTPEVDLNLRNALHAGNKRHKQGIYPGFAIQGSRTGVSVAHKRANAIPKSLKNYLSRPTQLDIIT